MTTPARDITTLLKAWRHGDKDAADRLAPLVYDQLRHVARGYLRRERGDGLLESRVLVHEAYVRLVEGADVDWKDRTHFFAIAARIMRRILDRRRTGARVGQTRRRFATGRSVERRGPRYDAGAATRTRRPSGVRSTMRCRRWPSWTRGASQVVELRFFGGLSVEETAAALQVSPQTVMRDWKLARAWLARALNR